jgi:hypothetical protein
MMWSSKNKKVAPLPEELASLVRDASSNHGESGAYRRAMAELEARTAWSLSKSTHNLSVATWVLAVFTAVLCLITLLKK